MVGYNWTTLFTKRTITEGEELADSGSVFNFVSNVGPQGGTISAEVTEDDHTYHVRVEVRRLWDRAYLSAMRCSCPEGRLCRHCAAVLSLVHMQGTRLYGVLVDNGRRYGLAGDGEAEPEKDGEEKKDAGVLPSLEELETLQKEVKDERAESGEESTYQPDASYNYFNVDRYAQQVQIRPEVRMRANQILQEGDLAEVRVRYVESDREKQGGVIGRFSCRFPSTRDSAYLEVGQDEILDAGCDSWSCYQMNRRNPDGTLRLCPHTAVLLRYLKTNLPGSGLGTNTNRAGQELIATVLGKSTVPEPGSSLHYDTLHMEPVLTLVRESGILAGFRIGTKRLYKVRDLKEFAEKMSAEKDMTFGKTTLHLGRTFLDGASQRWADFLLDYMGEERERMRHSGNYYFDPFDKKAEFPLYGDWLDRFMDLLMGEQAEFTFQEINGEKTKRTLLMQEKDPQIRLEIHGDAENDRGVFDGIRITGQIPQIIRGKRTGYYDTREHFNRISEEHFHSLLPILESQKGGQVLIRIGRGELGTFYHKVLPVLKTAVDITEYDTDEITPYLPPEPQFTIYLDTENDTVLCRA
ncbi:MAG: SNF2 helicase associated domain-containing protein, partial [Lachnospiraceae bacterium]